MNRSLTRCEIINGVLVVALISVKHSILFHIRDSWLSLNIMAYLAILSNG